MKLDQARSIARQLAGNWPELTVTEDTMRNWVEFLHPLSQDVGRAVQRQAVRTLDRVPHVADLERIRAALTVDAEREQAKERVRRSIDEALELRRRYSPDEGWTWEALVAAELRATKADYLDLGVAPPPRYALLLEIQDEGPRRPAEPEFPRSHPVDSADARERAEQQSLQGGGGR